MTSLYNTSFMAEESPSFSPSPSPYPPPPDPGTDSQGMHPTIRQALGVMLILTGMLFTACLARALQRRRHKHDQENVLMEEGKTRETDAEEGDGGARRHSRSEELRLLGFEGLGEALSNLVIGETEEEESHGYLLQINPFNQSDSSPRHGFSRLSFKAQTQRMSPNPKTMHSEGKEPTNDGNGATTLGAYIPPMVDANVHMTPPRGRAGPDITVNGYSDGYVNEIVLTPTKLLASLNLGAGRAAQPPHNIIYPITVI
eukprot:g27775.t1